MTKTLAILASAAVAALLAGSAIFVMGDKSGDRFAQCRESQVFGGDIGGPFSLVNAKGETVTDTDVVTGPTLIYFGYTFCPDICPADNIRNAEAVDLLEERGVMATPVFISIDPDRDTPEQMGAFSEAMHPRMIGLTGSHEQIKDASRAYRTYYKKQEPEEGDEDFYLVDHSTFTYLVFPEDGFVEFFKREDSPQQMADRVECFAKNH